MTTARKIELYRICNSSMGSWMNEFLDALVGESGPHPRRDEPSDMLEEFEALVFTLRDPELRRVAMNVIKSLRTAIKHVEHLHDDLLVRYDAEYLDERGDPYPEIAAAVTAAQ